MGRLWNTLFFQPTLKALVFFYQFLGNFGLAIIALTVLIRGLLVPLTLPAMRSAKRMQELAPVLEELKKKHGHNRRRHQEEQLKLYKKHGVNPATGCLPYLVQFLVLIALYQAFMFFLRGQEGINTRFLWLDLARPDPLYILPILAGISQLVMSKMMVAPQAEKRKSFKEPKEDMAKAMQEMQGQMVYLAPLMTVVIGARLPAGLALYWLVTTLFSLAQQYFTTGPGGLKSWLVVVKSRSGKNQDQYGAKKP